MFVDFAYCMHFNSCLWAFKHTVKKCKFLGLWILEGDLHILSLCATMQLFGHSRKFSFSI